MKKLIADFTKHLTEAIAIGEKSILSTSENKIENILITGLGGSGIGGTIVSEIISGESKVPVLVNKDYFLPAFVGKNTLVIVSSYSGNTEETLSAFKIAIERNAKIVCISSGGKILEIAKNKKIDFIEIPSGMPPRSAFGYSFTQLFFILHFFGIIKDGFKKNIQDSIQLLDAEESNIQQEAMKIAEKMLNTMPVIYSVSGNEGVAVRFRQQVNENSKVLCWHHVIPEMNHNELVGWKNQSGNYSVIIFRNQEDYSRSVERIEINKKVISESCKNIIEIAAKGNSRIERVLYHIHLGDWISVCIAELRNIDAMEVKVIDFLKNELAKR